MKGKEGLILKLETSQQNEFYWSHTINKWPSANAKPCNTLSLPLETRRQNCLNKHHLCIQSNTLLNLQTSLTMWWYVIVSTPKEFERKLTSIGFEIRAQKLRFHFSCSGNFSTFFPCLVVIHSLASKGRKGKMISLGFLLKANADKRKKLQAMLSDIEIILQFYPK